MATVALKLPFGIILAFLGMILLIVGVASPKWASGDTTGSRKDVKFTFGIFRECSGNLCDTISNPTDAQKATQAMAILACIAGAAGIAIAIAYTLLVARESSPRAAIRRLGGMCCIFAKIFIIISLVLFRIKIFEEYSTHHKDMELGYGISCTSVGGAGFLIGGFLIMVARGYDTERFTS